MSEPANDVAGRAGATAHNMRTGANIPRHIIAVRLEEAADAIKRLTKDLSEARAARDEATAALEAVVFRAFALTAARDEARAAVEKMREDAARVIDHQGLTRWQMAAAVRGLPLPNWHYSDARP